MILRFLLTSFALCSLLALAPPAAAASGSDGASIVAIVNGDVISREDVDNRRRLFALSTGLPLSQDVLDRLSPQITRQLIDERLRLQEAQRRRIVVPDADIAKAIEEVEARNSMAPGTLRKRLAVDGVAYRTLVDQIRVQIGWTRVLRQQLGTQAQVSDADIAEQERALKQQTGQPEFHVGEIFIPVDNPAQADDAQRFADTVIQQLHAGAPFPVVAAQFSQSQTALVGGDLGWVQPAQLDPAVLRVLSEMPPGAVSNPIRVPGGYDIVTLHNKREIGNDMATVLNLRQAFLPFTSRLDPANPTAQQTAALAQAEHLSATAPNCDTVEAAGKAAGSVRPQPWRCPARRRSARDALGAGETAGRKGERPVGVGRRHPRDHGMLARAEESRHLVEGRTGPAAAQRADRAGFAPTPARSAAARTARPPLLTSRGDNALPPLREVIARHRLDARRALGQHFLLDANVTARIVRQAGTLSGRHVVEVGPGPGGLTRALLDSDAAGVTAVEVDPRAVAAMEELAAGTTRLRVVSGDALGLDLAALVPAPRQIVANLPYNIASPLLVGWLRQAGQWERLTLMFQQEVAERICAAPGAAAYGRLSVLTQWVASAELRLRLPPAAFVPPPNVWSAVVVLTPHAAQPEPTLFAAMERLTAAAFGQRRKMLRGALRGLGGVALLAAAGIDPQRRAETLSIAEFDRLVRLLAP